DTSCISSPNYGNGYTIDNMTIFTSKSDLILHSLHHVADLSCNPASVQPVSATIVHSTPVYLKQVVVCYQVDGGAVFSEVVSIVPGLDTLDYTFLTQPDFSAIGTHVFDVWISHIDDPVKTNDSLKGTEVRTLGSIAQFPYYESFETGTDLWFANGTNSSWAKGLPSKTLIHKAANGNTAWVTNLTGTYHSNRS